MSRRAGPRSPPGSSELCPPAAFLLHYWVSLFIYIFFPLDEKEEEKPKEEKAEPKG